ncbi:MAG: ABC transporter permease subunit, partial [Proteobacteria bacterium]|nr:ABC transporter permease subunit [Pseudomonadota bacterium]
SIYDPIVGFDVEIFPHPTPPSSTHILGTDPLGRDVMSMFMAGSRPLIQMSLFSFFIGLFVTLFTGTLIPFLFKKLDLLMREVSSGVILMPPPLVLLILGTGEFVDKLSPSVVGSIYGVLSGLGVSFLVIRSKVMEIENAEYIKVSKLIGGSKFYIATKHVLPIVVPYAVSLMLTSTTYGIIAYGFASFFGQVGWTSNWGMMIYDAITYGSLLGGINYWNLIPPTLGFLTCSSSFYLLSVSVKKQFGISI